MNEMGANTIHSHQSNSEAPDTINISPLNQFILLGTALLAAYQIAVGVEGMRHLAVLCLTIAFGVLLVASLLILILGYEVLDNPIVVIISTIIPLSLSVGLVAEYLPALSTFYLVLACLGFVAVVLTRYLIPGKIATMVLAVVHGIAGLLIFGLPLYLSLRGLAPPGFALVGLGGALIGVGGLLLSFLKAGKPILSKRVILLVLPGLLLLTTTAFVAGLGSG